MDITKSDESGQLNDQTMPIEYEHRGIDIPEGRITAIQISLLKIPEKQSQKLQEAKSRVQAPTRFHRTKQLSLGILVLIIAGTLLYELFELIRNAHLE